MPLRYIHSRFGPVPEAARAAGVVGRLVGPELQTRDQDEPHTRDQDPVPAGPALATRADLRALEQRLLRAGLIRPA